MKTTTIIHGEPNAKGRPRFRQIAGHVSTYTPAKTANYENLVKLEYTQQNPDVTLTGALQATVKAYFTIPKSASKKRRVAMLAGEIRCTKKPDCDNLAKTVLDALNGIAYDDDKQVCSLTVEKWYGLNPRVEVTLEEIASE